MAYLLTHFWPGGTEESYRAMLAVVHPPNGLPDGQLYHAAGPTEGGFLIATVWGSKESSDGFVSDTLNGEHAGGGRLPGPARGARGRGFQPRNHLNKPDVRARGDVDGRRPALGPIASATDDERRRTPPRYRNARGAALRQPFPRAPASHGKQRSPHTIATGLPGAPGLPSPRPPPRVTR